MKGRPNEYIGKRFVDYVDIGMLFFDNNDKLVNFNDTVKEILHYDETDIGKSIEELFENNDEIIDFYYGDEKLKEFKQKNKQYINPNNKIKTKKPTENNKRKTTLYDPHTRYETLWFQIHKIPIYENNEFLGTMFTAHDVTEIKNTILEKEVLLKEVHHRVKNNLQIILSLLNLDMHFYPEDPEHTLENAKIRIYNIALIHEKIYNSKNLSSVNLKDYIHDIIEYMKDLTNGNIEFKLDLEDENLNINKAVPLGLIIIEIMNNSIKHAFSDGQNGIITLKSENEDGTINLIIYDNGTGTTNKSYFNNENENNKDKNVNNKYKNEENDENNKNSEHKSLGLIIINELIKQIDGKISNYPCEGTGFRIELKK